MSTKSAPCPHCAKPAAGNYCSHCGAPLLTACPACGAQVERGEKHCRACGAALTANTPGKAGAARVLAPWIAVGLAAMALVFALLSWFDRAGSGSPSAAMRFSESAPAMESVPGQPPDLSTMTPREAADRLFNRVMTAHEHGDKAQAMQFTPMALQAYANLGALDNDARYHVALIQLAADNTVEARAQVDAIHKTAPAHLLASILEHDLAVRNGNTAAAQRAYQSFLANYDAEIANIRSEYQDHAGTIQRFRDAALAATNGKKK